VDKVVGNLIILLFSDEYNMIFSFIELSV